MIGIVTLHGALNYGAVLQEFALQEAIKRCGGNVEIINYRSATVDRPYRLIDLRRVRGPRTAASEMSRAKSRVLRKLRFSDFSSRYLNLSKSVSWDQLPSLNSRYSSFVAGSDQVWNPDFASEDSAYFLSFADEPRKKSAYAPSFGVSEIPPHLAERYRALLSDFSTLSVRETTASRIVHGLTGRAVPVVLDPTLLLSPADWRRVSREQSLPQPYVLLYTASRSKALESVAQAISRERGLRVVHIDGGAASRRKFRVISSPHPGTWLWYFLNADVVLTNTFHGTAFSVNFGRQFYVDLPAGSARNSRIADLLSSFELGHRVLSERRVVDLASDKIDYGGVVKKLKSARTDSLGFLRSIVDSDRALDEGASFR